MSKGNGYGGYRTTLRADMAAHDACPPLLRHAANYAIGSWASRPLLQAWRQGEPERAIVAVMVRGDRLDTGQTYGPRHPEAAID